MSDIAGPPAPKPVAPRESGTDRAARTSRDPQQSKNSATDDSGGKQSRSEVRDQVHVRDPAVSIASSAAHLEVGEKLKETVRSIDAEGRPIIETETATFALRPDAGLKPGDAVRLEVVEAGKQVAADLLERNGIEVRPPLRLSLTVIAVHGPEASRTTDTEIPLPQNSNYRPKSAPTSAATTKALPNDPAALAALLSRNAQANASGATPPVSDNPDPLVKSSSQDLATLIAAQGANSSAKSTAGQPQAPQPPLSPLGGNTGTSARILSDSSLIKPLENAVEAALSSTKGLGAPVIGLSSTGAQVSVQLMDISISQVPPSEVAQVLSVQPLATEMARNLPVSAQALGAEALASVETNKGAFILPQAYAANLPGEAIRVTSITVQPATEDAAQTNETPVRTFTARLTAPGGEHARKVEAALVNQANTASPQLAGAQRTTIEAVHMARAFLTGEGPMNDLKLDTALGTLSTTLPSGLRPTAGDMIAILQASTVEAQNQSQPQIIQPTPALAATVAGEAAAGAITASSWPSFEQTYSLLQAAAPNAAATLANKSVQGGGKLLNSMVFLMAALKGGGPDAWLGKTASSALQDRNPGLLGMLKDDIAKLWSGGEQVGEWRPMLLPFEARGNDMPMLAALFANPSAVNPDRNSGHENPADEDDEGPQRFIIEAKFSKLGTMQLEGFVREKQFDLTLWSELPLPTALTTDLSQLFSAAVEANGFAGRLNFRPGDPFPVDVAKVLSEQLAA
jgi:hypothetical protein